MSPRIVPIAVVMLATLTLPAFAERAREIMSDSTVMERWTLVNGLRVLTRHIPDAGGVSVTVGYRIGSDHDPSQRQGLAQLMSILAFTSAAGDIPERTREEIESQRPLGWSYPVTRRTTLFTEVATVEQFPGMLSQIATRMRGVQVTGEQMAAGLKEAQREMAQQMFGAAEVSLYFQVREVALGHTDEDILRRATGKDLETLTLKELQGHINRLYVPANAVLAIAGNLGNVDVQTLVQNLFGSIPAGTPRPDVQGPALEPRRRLIFRDQLPGSQGVVGVIAPALADTLHPSFYLTALLFGSHVSQTWIDKDAPRAVRYQYALFDEPDLVRFYPVLGKSDRDTEILGPRMSDAMEILRGQIVPKSAYDALKRQVMWQFGGPLGESVLDEVRTNGSLLHQLSRTEAARSMSGDHGFWSDYRRRFERALGFSNWSSWLLATENQVRLLYATRP